MLRSEERRAALFWKGYGSEAVGAKDAVTPVADRIMDFYYGRLSGRAKSIMEIAELFGMDVVAVSKIIKSRKNAVRRKYWAAETRKATARRKQPLNYGSKIMLNSVLNSSPDPSSHEAGRVAGAATEQSSGRILRFMQAV